MYLEAVTAIVASVSPTRLDRVLARLTTFVSLSLRVTEAMLD